MNKLYPETPVTITWYNQDGSESIKFDSIDLENNPYLFDTCLTFFVPNYTNFK